MSWLKHRCLWWLIINAHAFLHTPLTGCPGAGICMTMSLVHSQTWPYFFPGSALFLQFIEPCQPTKHLWEAKEQIRNIRNHKEQMTSKVYKATNKETCGEPQCEHWDCVCVWLWWTTVWTLGPCLGVTPESFQQTNHERWLPRKEIFSRCILNNGLQCRINNPWKLTTRRQAIQF